MLILFQMFLKSILEDVGFSVVSVFFLSGQAACADYALTGEGIYEKTLTTIGS